MKYDNDGPKSLKLNVQMTQNLVCIFLALVCYFPKYGQSVNF